MWFDDADRERFRDVLGDRQQLGHRLERAPQIVLIEAGDNHALATIRQRIAGRRQIGVEKLPFVDPDDLRVVVDLLEHLVRAPDVLRCHPHVTVRHDMAFAEAVVEERLEDLHVLAGDLGAAQAANQLLALSAEHAAADDLDPPVLGLFVDDVHRRILVFRRHDLRHDSRAG